MPHATQFPRLCYVRSMVSTRPVRRGIARRLALAPFVAAACAPLAAYAAPPPLGGPDRTAASSAAASSSAAPSAAPLQIPTADMDRTLAGPERNTRLRPSFETATPAATRSPDAAAGGRSPGPSRACSFTVPVCVHAPPQVPVWAAREVLRDAERALSGYRALGLPMPLADGARGGTSAYDLYIDPAASASRTFDDPETEPRTIDQAAAFTVFPVPSTWGCDVAFDVAKGAAEAILFRFDAAAERGLVTAASSYLASIVAPCAARETPGIDAFQAEPFRAISDPSPDFAAGAMLFPMYLEENEGAGDPGRLLLSLFAIASQKSDPGQIRYQNEPDVFDALRSSMRFRRGSLDDLLLDFAVDRAFVGDRGDGGHLWATDLYGAAGRVFFEWSVPYSSLPRRLAPLHPLSPTGAAYVWLDLAGAPKDAEITFVADWELPAVFRWSLVKVDKNGAESGRIDVAGIVGTTHVERTVVLREELAGLIVVGTNTGGLDRTMPFDPDFGATGPASEPSDAPPIMPHSYEITIYGPIPSSTTNPFVRPMDSSEPSTR